MKSFRLSSPLKVEEDSKVIEKQGIVSILGSDCDRTKVASLRRTLSADMSSKKWLAQNGFFSPMKKIASSEEFPISITTADSSSSSSDGEDNDQLEKIEKPGQFDVWSSILCQKVNDELPPPYIHPLVKRSTSSLTEKSLEVCTESLGSETGSDGFSSYPASETGDIEEETQPRQQQQQQQQQQQEKEYYYSQQSFDNNNRKKLLPKSFPPPLPSLARGHNGPSVHMQCCRQNGRLVVEAVSVPSQNYFHAQRQDGRLVLTLVNNQEEEEFEEVFENEVEVEAEEEEEEILPKQSSGVINVHRSAIMMKRLMGMDNRNPTWTHKFKKAVDLVEMEVEEEAEAEEVATQFPQSLPPPHRVARLIPAAASRPAAAASLNAYEYFWRTKPSSVATMINPLKNNCNKATTTSPKPKAHEKQELVLLRGNKADYLDPLLRGCKEPRRSLLIWEPYCIATS